MQYTTEQEREIELGKESGIDVSFYSDSSLSPIEMKLRRLYLEYGIELPNTKKINTQCLNLIENILKKDIDVNVEKYFENLEYNAFNHIDPKSVIREVSEEVLNLDYGLPEETKKENSNEKKYDSKEEIEKEISKLLKEIKKLSEELDFENAIKKRDEMIKLKNILLEL